MRRDLLYSIPRTLVTDRPHNPQALNFKILREFPSPDLERAWRDYLARIESPSHYESPEYFLEPLWAGKPRFAILALENNRVMGVLTGLLVGKHLMCGLKSRPQISVDPAGDTAAAMEMLAKGLLTEAETTAAEL